MTRSSESKTRSGRVYRSNLRNSGKLENKTREIKYLTFKDKKKWDVFKTKNQKYGWSSQPFDIPRIREIIWDNNGKGKSIKEFQVKNIKRFGYDFVIENVAFETGAFEYIPTKLKAQIKKEKKKNL